MQVETTELLKMIVDRQSPTPAFFLAAMMNLLTGWSRPSACAKADRETGF